MDVVLRIYDIPIAICAPRQVLCTALTVYAHSHPRNFLRPFSAQTDFILRLTANFVNGANVQVGGFRRTNAG